MERMKVHKGCRAVTPLLLLAPDVKRPFPHRHRWLSAYSLLTDCCRRPQGPVLAQKETWTVHSGTARQDCRPASADFVCMACMGSVPVANGGNGKGCAVLRACDCSRPLSDSGSISHVLSNDAKASLLQVSLDYHPACHVCMAGTGTFVRCVGWLHRECTDLPI